MNNLCKVLLCILSSLCFLSCTDTKEPLFETLYVYKNTLSTAVSVEFYRKNSEKLALAIGDSIIIHEYSSNYTFGPEYNDSIVFVFDDGKKVIFKDQDKQTPIWNLNATNTNAYRRSDFLRDNLKTYVYTYTIDDTIYDLAE